jgi:outer membrane protein OmpA-like peptidoglycan-associated protein
VVGYGLGIALGLNAEDGVRIARGGMLLFLTNLVAIIFTAMVVFVTLHINTQRVKERVREWQQADRESGWVRRMLGKLPVVEKLRVAGSLPGRFVTIVIIILLILVPLTQSFLHLKQEIARKQQENRIRVAAVKLWEENFSRMPDGEPRCYLGQFSLVDREGVLALLMRVFTIKPYTTQEKAEYTRLVAARIDRPVQSVVVRLIEIPTVSSELLTKAREGGSNSSLVNDEKRAEEILTIGQLETSYAQAIETALGDLRLPAPATLVDYEVTTHGNTAPRINLVYLSERHIEVDAQTLLADDLRKRFENPEAHVSFERIETAPVSLTFGRNQTQLETRHAEVLDRVGHQLQRFASLRIEMATGADRTEREELAEERGRAIVAYFTDKWKIDSERIEFQPNDLQKREATLKFPTGDSAPRE